MSGRHVYESGRKSRVNLFVDALIRSGDDAKDGLEWAAFVGRSDVETELASRVFELCEDGANHNPNLRRFFAAPREKR
jgi:hypothetical protein